MKLASLTASLILLASLAQAKDRFLVQFKSQQGFKAMESYFNVESGETPMQESLSEVKAIVLKTKNANLIESLKNHPEVANVEAEFFIPAPKPVNGFGISKQEAFIRKLCKDPAYRRKHSSCSDFNLKVLEATPWGLSAVNIGKAWELSRAGEKARVLILDTGVDDGHPSVSANFEKGKNFVEGDTGAVDPKDYLDTVGHGTHVAGTVLGVYNKKNGFTGVAPRAKLLMGKVCGQEGCSSIAIIEGINWGIKEKVDVISMSLGGPYGSPAEKQATVDADKAGITIVAASGNGAGTPNYSPDRNDPNCGGDGNPFMPNSCGVSFPAAFPTVIAVGAINSALEKTTFSQWGPELDIVAPGQGVISSIPRGTGRESKVELTINGKKKTVKSNSFTGTNLFSAPVINTVVVIPGMGKPEDFKGVDVAGKFALISRGEIKFADKVKNAIDAKAAGVLIYNNAPGLMQGSLSEDGSTISYPVVMIEQATGQELVQLLTKGGKATASVLVAASNYASFDGTSMATPHVAGVVALMKAANKKLTPLQIKGILISTARPLAPNDTNQFGAGLVQAEMAVKIATKFKR